MAQQVQDLSQVPDLILATDMLDLATFAGLIRPTLPAVPLVLFMHENQLTYPWSPTDADVKLQRDRHYAWINYTSTLVADRVFFNSQYHLDSFLGALPAFLRAFPDHQHLDTVADIAAKSEVLSLGMDLVSQLELAKTIKPTDVPHLRPDDGGPVLLWNHRWEYDKDPAAFFELCFRLANGGLGFQLVVLGEAYAKAPPVFAEARERLSDRILHWGYAKESVHYAYWLHRADLLPVTGIQDFFGGSVVEAIAAGIYPLLPDRLAYPSHIPAALRNQYLYPDFEALVERCMKWLAKPTAPDTSLVSHQMRYDWQEIVAEYDTRMCQVIAS